MAAPALTQYIQGQGQVSADNLNTFEQTCDTFAQLRTLVGLPGMQVFARGGLSIADGNQGVFYWQATNPGPDNGATVIVPNGATIGAWVKISLSISTAGIAFGQGRLVYNSSTQISFNPYNGNGISIAGNVFSIPAAGIQAGNTGVFVNGAANQNLVASTLYYIYLFNNSGTPTIDYSTTAYAQDTTAGNIGVYIKNSTPSRSLIGMAFVDGSSLFNDTSRLRNVASWFNRQGKVAAGVAMLSVATGSQTMTEIGNGTTNRLELTCWADDSTVRVGISGIVACDTTADIAYAGVGDGSNTNIFDSMGGNSASGFYQLPLSGALPYTATEGHHVFRPLGAVNTGGTNCQVTGTLRGEVRN